MINSFDEYEKAKSKLRDNGSLHAERLKKALLEYRRQHNIFEVGDKVVYRKQCSIIWDGVYTVDAVLSNGDVIERDCQTPREWLSRATSEEIKAGRRL